MEFEYGRRASYEGAPLTIPTTTFHFAEDDIEDQRCKGFLEIYFSSGYFSGKLDEKAYKTGILRVDGIRDEVWYDENLARAKTYVANNPKKERDDSFLIPPVPNNTYL